VPMLLVLQGGSGPCASVCASSSSSSWLPVVLEVGPISVHLLFHYFYF